MLFPLPHQVFVTRNPNYLHSLWIGIWHAIVVVFYAMLWVFIIRSTWLHLCFVTKGLFGCVCLAVKMLVYGVLGGVGTRNITPFQYYQEHRAQHLARFMKVEVVETDLKP